MNFGYSNGFVYRLARTLIGSLSIGISLFDTTTKHQDRATVREVPVHSIMFKLMNNIGLLHLLFYFRARASFRHHVTAEFACENNKRSVEMPGFFQIFYELGKDRNSVL